MKKVILEQFGSFLLSAVLTVAFVALAVLAANIALGL